MTFGCARRALAQFTTTKETLLIHIQVLWDNAISTGKEINVLEEHALSIYSTQSAPPQHQSQYQSTLQYIPRRLESSSALL